MEGDLDIVQEQAALGVNWWKEVGANYPQGIPQEKLPGLCNELRQNMDCSEETALGYAREAGVLSENTETRSEPGENLDPQTGDENTEDPPVPAIQRGKKKKRKTQKKEKERTHMPKRNMFADMSTKELIKHFWPESDGGSPTLLHEQIHAAGRTDVSKANINSTKHVLLHKDKWKPNKKEAVQDEPKRRGRRPGSKNKKKTNTSTPVIGNADGLAAKINEIRARMNKDSEALDLLLRAQLLIGESDN